MPTPKISLCIIAGNVERYIQRFLDSFAPLVDEIVVVSAIGKAVLEVPLGSGLDLTLTAECTADKAGQVDPDKAVKALLADLKRQAPEDL